MRISYMKPGLPCLVRTVVVMRAGLRCQRRKSLRTIMMTAPSAGKGWRQPVNCRADTCFIGVCEPSINVVVSDASF